MAVYQILQKFLSKTKFIIFLIFVFSFSLLLFAISNNDNTQIDEPFSIYISAPTYKLENQYFFNLQNGEYDFKNLYKALYIPNNKNIISDLKVTRLQILDNPHPPLYYFCLRLWNINTKPLNAQNLLMKARFLNLLFFIMAFFLMYKLLNLLFEDKKSVIAGLCFTFFSSGIIYLFGMAREYALQCMLHIAFLLSVCKFYKAISNNYKINFKESLILGITGSLFLLSGYFSTLFAAIYIAIIIGASLIKKKFKILLYLLISLIIGLAIVLTLSPNYFLISPAHYRTVQCIDIIKNLYHFCLFKMFMTFKTCLSYIIKYLYYPVIFCIGIGCWGKTLITNSKNKTQNNNNNQKFLINILLSISFLITYIIILISPLKYARFILPTFPILSILFVILFKNIKPSILTLIICLYLVLSVHQITSKSYYDYDTNKSPKILIEKPLPLVTDHFSWECVNLFFTYSKYIKTVIIDDDISNIKYDKYFLFYPKKYRFHKKPYLKMLENNLYYIDNME